MNSEKICSVNWTYIITSYVDVFFVYQMLPSGCSWSEELSFVWIQLQSVQCHLLRLIINAVCHIGYKFIMIISDRFAEKNVPGSRLHNSGIFPFYWHQGIISNMDSIHAISQIRLESMKCWSAHTKWQVEPLKQNAIYHCEECSTQIQKCYNGKKFFYHVFTSYFVAPHGNQTNVQLKPMFRTIIKKIRSASSWWLTAFSSGPLTPRCGNIVKKRRFSVSNSIILFWHHRLERCGLQAVLRPLGIWVIASCWVEYPIRV